MSIICSVCNSNAGIAVCHHCGKPLCKDEKCLIKLKKDDIFSTSTTAYHCNDCFKEFHPNVNLQD